MATDSLANLFARPARLRYMQRLPNVKRLTEVCSAASDPTEATRHETLVAEFTSRGSRGRLRRPSTPGGR